MGYSELSFARQQALTTRDWDTYQLILRRCLAALNPVGGRSGRPRQAAVSTTADAGRARAVVR